MSLPQPSPDALAHSHLVAEHIQQVIAAGGGWISFARYMELALYAPGLGYYSAGAAKLGSQGDFVTAPEISSYFGRTLARPIANVLRHTGGSILELGAGSGRLALDILGELAGRDELPEQYLILEVSADLRERQRLFLARHAPQFLERLVWLEALPTSFVGVIVANEVLDALPVHVLHWGDEDVLERGVVARADSFAWEMRSLPDGPLRELALRLAPGTDYTSEVSLAVPAFVRGIGAVLLRGRAFFIDYGFLRREYYHAQRKRGTLMCHYRHHAHDDPFYLPGLQDITAHVDFTSVAEAAKGAGLQVATYATQARFLIDSGITDVLAELDPSDAATYLPAANKVQRLLSPAEMGELFKVMVLAKGVVD
jgi:SAM-dependent MidA family methyltransferase